MTGENHRTIGILADSHGDAQGIESGAIHLRRRGCSVIYHLGDICDTNRWQTADRCVSMVKRHGIRAVRGNNDHSLAADARGRVGGRLKEATILFLESLPLSLSAGGATMVHSRPFIRQLGLAAMIGVMGRDEAERYFEETPDGLLFRGHSHRPELISRSKGRIRFEPVEAARIIELGGRRPCIVTCGALAAGFAMVWDVDRDRLECCSLD